MIVFRYITPLLFLLVLSANSFGQRCLTSLKKAEALKKDTNLAEKLNAQEATTQRWIRANGSTISARNVETLPVVVHIIWRLAEEDISTEQIESQMQVLNDDFRKLNSNFSSTPTPFKDLAADIGIEFCLASIDPEGNPTSGITRTKTAVDNIGTTNNWYQNSKGGKDAWDVTKYINIWVCDMGDDGTLGFASTPGAAVPESSDGMVIGYPFFGTTGTASNQQPNHLGRTVTHEMGHYFNLEHVWGDGNGGCSQDDFVADTPNQFTESGGCPTFPLLDNCTTSGNGVMFNNYMDYSSDICMTMFTKGQKERMLAALNGPRASLLTSNIGCSDIVDEGPTSIEKTIKNTALIAPNPTKESIKITLKQKLSTTQTFELYNASGHKMMVFQASSSTIKIDVSAFPNGVYFLKASDGSIAPQKFIVLK